MQLEELKSKLRGVVCSLVTPFDDDYSLDLQALYDNAQRVVEKGIHVLLAAGSVGEFSSLSPEEFRDVVATVVKATQGRVPVMAGASHSGTHECIRLSRMAEDVGADALLIVPPYYFNPSVEGLLKHYEMVAESVRVGVAVYNNPGYSKVNITPEQFRRLVEQIPQVVSVKDTSGELYNFYETLRLIGHRIPVLMGRELTAFFGLACGSPGYVSSLANLAPGLCLALYDAFRQGNLEEGRRVNEKIAPFNQLQTAAAQKLTSAAMIPLIKEGMNMLGLRGGQVRPPLTSADSTMRDELKKILREWGLI